MKPAPKTRRSFSSNWAELVYLRDKLDYWLHERRSFDRARRFALRLKEVFRQTCQDDNEAIIAEECRSLLAEFSGEWEKAAAHRSREIKLCQRAHELAANEKSHVREYALQGIGKEHIAKLFVIMAGDLRKSGKEQEAEEAMSEYLAFCKRNSIAPDMLEA